MALPRKETSENISSFAEVKTRLKDHYAFLLNHLKYTNRIIKGEISELEQLAYIQDVFGEKKITKEDLDKNILPQLIDTLNTITIDAQMLLKAANTQNQDNAICYLFLLLNHIIVYSSMKNRIANSRKVSINGKIQTAFHEYLSLKKIYDFLEKLLPEYYADFSKVFKVTEKYNEKFDGRNKACTFSAYISIDWDNHIFKSVLTKLEGESKNLNKNTSIPPHIQDALKYFKEIDDLKKSNRIQYQKAVDDADDDKVNKIVDKNVDLFFRAYPVIKEAIKCFADEKDNAINKDKLENSYKKSLNKTTKEISFLREQYESCIAILNRAKKITTNVDDDLIRSLDKINNDINKIQALFPAILPKGLKTTDDIDNNFKIFNEMQKKVAINLDDCYQSAITYYKKLTNEFAAENEKLKQLEQEKMTSFLKEREEYLTQKKLTHQSYHSGVLEKQGGKAKTKIIANPKPLVLDENNNNVTVKNISLEERLIKVIKNHSSNSLLKGILNLEFGILYDEVCNLVNNLGGEVSAKKGSHRCIKLEKIYVEIIGSGVDIENLPENVTTLSTGGFFRPHGKSHNKGLISGFNLVLVKKVFTDAGITLDYINMLEQKIMLQKDNEEKEKNTLKP